MSYDISQGFGAETAQLLVEERARKIIRAYDMGAVNKGVASMRLKMECNMTFDEAIALEDD